ncbi:hypothetical protein ES703_90898 [subsurface metagenome]
MAKDIKAHFKCKVGYDHAQICVSASFAQAVNCALDVPGTSANGSERIGCGAVSIIMGVNPNHHRAETLADSLRDFVHFVG